MNLEQVLALEGIKLIDNNIFSTTLNNFGEESNASLERRQNDCNLLRQTRLSMHNSQGVYFVKGVFEELKAVYDGIKKYRRIVSRDVFKHGREYKLPELKLLNTISTQLKRTLALISSRFIEDYFSQAEASEYSSCLALLKLVATKQGLEMSETDKTLIAASLVAARKKTVIILSRDGHTTALLKAIGKLAIEHPICIYSDKYYYPGDIHLMDFSEVYPKTK